MGYDTLLDAFYAGTDIHSGILVCNFLDKYRTWQLAEGELVVAGCDVGVATVGGGFVALGHGGNTVRMFVAPPKTDMRSRRLCQLKCRCQKDDYDCEAFYPVYGNWRDLGFKYGDVVDVIVLAKEEECK